MRQLELNEMTQIEGGGFWSGFACAATVIASAAVIAGTAGTGTVVAAYATGAACGGLLGYGMASGDFL